MMLLTINLYNYIYQQSETTESKEFADNPFYISAVQPRLDAVLMVLKTCEGSQYVEPWKYCIRMVLKTTSASSVDQN